MALSDVSVENYLLSKENSRRMSAELVTDTRLIPDNWGLGFPLQEHMYRKKKERRMERRKID